MRVTGRGLAWALLSIAGSTALASAAAAQGHDPREERFLAGFARGEEVRALARELAARPRPVRAAARDRSETAAGLERAVISLERLSSRSSLDAGDAAAVATEVLAFDLLARERFADNRRRLAEAGIGGTVVARLDAAERRYEERFAPLRAGLERWLGDLAEPPAGRARAAVAVPGAVFRGLATLGEGGEADSEPLLRALALPYRPQELAARTPVVAPAIEPSYRLLVPPLPTAADLASTPEAPLTAEIVAQAAALGYDYVRLFEFVRNEIDTERYAGSLKGAEETLRQRRGNDVDQASLLVALLRASGMACRYVRGAIEQPIADLAAEFGTESPTAIAALLARSGVAARPIVRGGAVAAFELEHTWISAWAPYSNYRGSVVDFSGRTWIPLAPALEGHVTTPSTRVLESMGLAVDDELAAYLAAPQDEEPLSRVRRQVEAWLVENRPDESYVDQLGARSVVPERLSHLPSSLPVRTVAVTAESSALAPADRQTIRFRAFAGTAPGEPVVLDHELPVARLLGRRTTISYIPASVDDHRTVMLFGGLGRVPAYLVDVRPVLRIEGREVAVGQAMPLAVPHDFETTIAGPWGSERIEQTFVSGSYQALAVGGPRADGRADDGGDPSDAEQLAARLLSSLAYRFAERWDVAERELAGLLDVALATPLPSVALVANAVEVTHLAGIPEGLEWQGVTLDAALRATDPVARGGDAEEAIDYQRFAALQGSALERFVFEDEFLVGAISADHGLGLARAAGIPVETIDAGNVAAMLALLDHPPAVEAEIERWALAGATIEVPRTAVARDAWSGSVFRVDDPATGAAGYYLSGGLAGGATTAAPEDWVLQFLAEALAAPYDGEPNPDPMSAATIVKITATDGQYGTVGTLLPVELAVEVRDAAGRPVRGAAVTFTTGRDDGRFEPLEGEPGDEVTVLTDRTGVAAVPFRLGTDTSLEPVYLLRDDGDAYSTRALAHVIDAVVASSSGAIPVDAPIEAFGFPGPPATLRRTDSDETYFVVDRAASWVDTMVFVVEDSHGNPISNIDVSASFSDMFEDESCTNAPSSPQPGAVFDSRECSWFPGDPLGCEVAEYTGATSSYGIPIGVVTGSAFAASYTYSTWAGGFDPQVFEYGVLYTQSSTTGECSPWRRVDVASWWLINELGENIQATSPGSTFGRAIPMTVAAFVQADGNFPMPGGGGETYPGQSGDGQWAVIEAALELEVSNGGSATPPILVEGPSYETQLATGPAVGFHSLEVEVTTDFFGMPSGPETFGPYLVNGVWALDAALDPIADLPIVLTDDGRLAEELVLSYRILPEDYRARTAEIVLLEDGDEIGVAAASPRSGAGQATVQRGYEFDQARTYSAQLVLNRGTEAEMRSSELLLPFSQRLFSELDRQLFLGQDIDLVNERVCEQPAKFHYRTGYEANVSLVFRGIYRELGGAPQYDGSEITLLAGGVEPAGSHDLDILTSDLLPGEYEWELRGVSTADGHVEIERGFARFELVTRDSLAVGHALVGGVDAFDGHLVLSRQDVSIPARGIDLEFSRTFSSSDVYDPGSLGPGWSHNWQSFVTVLPCGDIMVVGGEGSGMRFADDGEGGLRPLRGYHGTLRANWSTLTFDFFAKGGRRYHYVYDYDTRWRLAFVEDPNGNRVTLVYEPSSGGESPFRLAAVVDDAGRQLTFAYQRRSFAQWVGEVLVSVSGPDGLRVTFTYDPVWGTLIRAERETHSDGSPSRVESYRWELRNPFWDDRKVLVEARDEISAAETLFEYLPVTVGAAGVLVQRISIESITKPRGGVKQFAFDLAGLEARAEETETVVTDERGKEWRYVQNRYGATIRQIDPLDQLTVTEWTPDDVLVTARTDANGVRTEYDYDEHGNLLSESVEVIDVDNGAHTYVESRTYVPPSEFELPIKDRLATRTDRNGATTTFEYDARGNLLAESVVVTDVDAGARTLTIGHDYFPNGDRASTTDHRGSTTRFRYDATGNLTEVHDPLNHKTVSAFDARGRMVSRTDARFHATTFEYDVLDRRVRTVHPLVEGEATPAEERVVYDDASRTRTDVDARNRSTVTTLDLEGNVASIVNAEQGTKILDYDLAGNKTLESTWFDQQTPRHDTIFDYDDAGRLERRDEPHGRRTVYQYDAVGNLRFETVSDTTDPAFEPRLTEKVYDALNREIAVIRDPSGLAQRIEKLLDGNGNVVALRDPLDRETLVDYDELDRRIRETRPEWRAGQAAVTEWLFVDPDRREEERRYNQRELPNGTFESNDQVRKVLYDERGLVRRREDAEGKAWTYEYDAVGNLVREVDRRGVLVTSDYDERNRRIRRTEVLNKFTVPARDVVTEWSHDGNGNVVEERLPNGNVVTHVYDGLNRRTESSDELGALSTADYDARGNVIGETDASGNELTREYDALDRLVAEHLPEDRDFAFTYDVAGNRLTHENARGFTTEYEYDALNRLTRTIDPAPFGYDTILSWDLAGNKKTEQNRRDFVTSYDYDELDRLVRIDDPAAVGTFQSFTYDAIGNRLSATDRRGIRTSFAWDRENRLLSTTRSGITLESNQYDGNGNRIFTTDARGHTTGFEYDERNLLKSENRPLAAITRFALDDLGDRIRRIDPEGRVTEWSYDLRRRQLREKRLMDPGNSSDDEEQASCYDGNGNRIARFEPEAFSALAGAEPCESPFPGAFRYGFDAANRLTSVRDPLGHLTSYGYDPSGNRTSQTDDNSHTTSFEYDALERLTRKIYPQVAGVAAEESYGYDANGNRTGLTDPLGQAFSWQYDALDRETLATYPPPTPPRGDDLQSIATAYDGNGNVETVTETYSGPSGTRTTSQTWDAFDRLRTKTDPEGELLTYGYDAAGNRNRLTDPDGRTTLYQHDALNRLQSVLPPGTGATLYEYLGNSLLKRITYPNGATAAYGYDRANRVTSIENRQHTALVSSYVYAYDRNGNRTSQEETNGGAPETTTYVYDDADRLTEVHYPDETVVYTLDGVGNRQTEVTTDTGTGTITSNKTYGYNERDFLLSVTDSVEPANNTNYAYDVNGNQIEKTAVQSGVISSFIYDVRDQLVEVSTSTGLLETYGYSYDGLRTRKSGPGGLFRFVYDERSLLLQTDLAGITIAKYEWGPDRLLSLDHAVEGRQFYLFDGLGSVASLSKPDGTLQARFRWDAWGNLRSQAGDSFNLFGFTGHQRDEETGLYYFGARFYDPELGRFLNEDPFGGVLETPPSLHRFLYANASPVRFTDPLGLYSWEELGRDLQFVQDVAVGTLVGMYDPRNAGKNLQRGVGGAVGTAKMLGGTAVGLLSLAADNASGMALPGAFERNAGRAEALADFISHPVDTIVDAHAVAIQKIEAHEAKGEYFQSGMVGGEIGSADALAVAGGIEGAGALARGAGRLTTRALSVDFAGIEAGFSEAVAPLGGAPRVPFGTTTTSVPVRVQSAVVGESSTSGGAAVSEVSTTQSAPALGSSAERSTPPIRPSWQAAQAGPADDLAQFGFESEPSFFGGSRVSYGTRGSVRPDYASEQMMLSVDVKNYDLTTAKGRWRLVRDVVGQSESRARNLPEGMQQGVIIDIRGQQVNDVLLQRMLDRIVQKSDGLIHADNVVVQRADP
ncbi:MAG: hypothetical protein AMXMBFR36_29710 [Acidobacteriota bacterium]